MKVFSFVIAALTLAAGVSAVGIQKSVLFTYPRETPDWVVDQAKKAIEEAGGLITHEYTLIKGFAAKVGDKAIGTVSAMGEQYKVLVEEDQEVHIA
ncbi:uncharacterized protein C8A04DRAFT_14534 [Dichotomopilus funicola]|uniref:Uncharacterized protein n=1 Tax=Dichotomopilus funicola TaxID=1934379 RepID=A0AAN6ZK81_9PEZI|nr:hypothetical protein C8A04DRAFT_14534 [Dichotomopilus funicola]